MRLLRSLSSWRNATIVNEEGEVTGQVTRDLNEMDFTAEQKAAAKQLRDRIGHGLPPHLSSDFEILKWLAASNFDVDQAEQRLLKSLVWRKEWEVDSILNWKPPEVLTKYYPAGLSGYDKEGAPVWIIPYGRCDMRGLLHSCQRRDYIRYTLQILEKSLEDMRNRSKDLVVPIRRQSCIFDLDYFSIKHITWKPAMDVILQLVQIYEANYPELLKCAFVINAPKVFTIAYALIKPFLHEVTLSKIRIFGQTGWKEAILKEVAPDQLPVHWGGSLCDPDGDTKCPSMICIGGEVPTSYYLKKKINETSDFKTDHLQSLILPKTGKKIIELEVKNPDTELRWEFQSDNFDVGFGISRVSSAGEEVLLHLQRVNSHLVPEEGSLICTDPGTYRVIFDNEYSYLRSKKLYYNLQLFPPTERAQL